MKNNVRKFRKRPDTPTQTVDITALVPDDAFLLGVKGDGLAENGINDGDVVILNMSLTPRPAT